MSDPYHDRFSGIARLYGTGALEVFRRSTVMVAGIGGVGSWAAESLARSGVGHLVLVDPDDLCVTNTNRQIHADDGTYGRPKVTAMAERLRRIHPGIEITELQSFYSEKTADEVFSTKPEAVIDAIDSLRAKCHLLATSRSLGVPVIASGAAGGRRDPTRLRVADLAHTSKDSLLASVRKKLRTEFGFPSAPERGRAPDFEIEAVFSDETPLYPTCEGGVSHERPSELPAGLRCDAGYGSVTHVTAAFGLAAAGRVLDWLVPS
ncbi:tRNA threonylcarbamoyladenosine dehydratase [Haloferula helveola]|uniref:tRNA threonylcarbamoyladenosine dehydratase n=1 Tax=Haloferula helveola TaxID=490095 RepID=UPI0030D26F46